MSTQGPVGVVRGKMIRGDRGGGGLKSPEGKEGAPEGEALSVFQPRLPCNTTPLIWDVQMIWENAVYHI